MNSETVADKLNYWHEKICTPEFIEKDPVQFPHRYKRHEDIEIAAFLSAAIAWGRRDLILRSSEKMFALMGSSPYDYVMSDGFKSLKSKNIHRTFFENDLKYYCRGFKRCYANYSNIENLFSSAHKNRPGYETEEGWIWNAFALFREGMANANKGEYSRHVSNPASACKKLNLALRWLVRKGPVDLGLWKKIKPASLYIPLDVHVARTARDLGLLERKSNDKKTACELTEKLRVYCPEDPVKYDFALFGLGVSNVRPKEL